MAAALRVRGLHSDEPSDNAHSSASIDSELNASDSDPQSLSSLAPFLQTSTSDTNAETDDSTDGHSPLSTLAPFLPDSGDNGSGSSKEGSSSVSSPSATQSPSTLQSITTSKPTATPATTSPAASSDSDAFSSLPSGTRAGIIGGIVGFLVLVLLGLLFLFTRRRHRLHRADRVARQREKMDDDPSRMIADLPRPPFVTTQNGGRVVSYAPTLPPKDEIYAAAGQTEGVSTIRPLDAQHDESSENEGTGAGWRLRRGRERADTDALGAGESAMREHNGGRRNGSVSGGLKPTAMAARHSRTRSTGIDLATLNGPRLDDMVREEAEREEERAQRAEAGEGPGFELQRVRSDSDPKLRGHLATQRSSRTVVLPVVPFAPTWREGVDSARTSVKSWGSWAWPSGKDGKEVKDESKV